MPEIRCVSPALPPPKPSVDPQQGVIENARPAKPQAIADEQTATRPATKWLWILGAIVLVLVLIMAVARKRRA